MSGSTDRLERQNGIIAGVCGGLAARFRWDPTIVRLIFALMLLPGGVPGLVPYLLLWLIMPAKQ
jgi:phage shock protein PspC (stress-responsive transcriptional regulator)